MKHVIQILTTGGTIDKSYNEFNGAIKNRESVIRELLLNRLRLPGTEILIEEVMSKDSLDLTEADRDYIYEVINEKVSSCSAIIVIHGTDTMQDTLKYCFEKNNIPKVPVIFTGAMRPAVMQDSDALQNMTEAILTSKVVDPGYYITFHGQILKAPNVRKNRTLGTFESY